MRLGNTEGAALARNGQSVCTCLNRLLLSSNHLGQPWPLREQTDSPPKKTPYDKCMRLVTGASDSTGEAEAQAHHHKCTCPRTSSAKRKYNHTSRYKHRCTHLHTATQITHARTQARAHARMHLFSVGRARVTTLDPRIRVAAALEERHARHRALDASLVARLRLTRAKATAGPCILQRKRCFKAYQRIFEAPHGGQSLVTATSDGST
eukprot:2903148-Pleurochrysis_carterae.AAC.2